MAGGTWEQQNKVRAGAYINVESGSLRTSSAEGTRGVVITALPLSWGEGMITLDGGSDISRLTGLSVTSKEYLLLVETLKNARTVLLYRLNEGVKAKTSGDVVFTAKYGGALGNTINIRVVPFVGTSGTFEVTTLVNGVPVNTQYLTKWEYFEANDFIELTSSTGDLEAVVLTLAGGTDGTVVNGDYSKFFASAEVQEYNVMTINSETSEVITLATNFIKRMRDNNGHKVQLVISGLKADHEAIVNVRNGYITQLADGTTVELKASEAVFWVAGAMAMAGGSRSLTYTKVAGSIDAFPRLTNAETIDGIVSGEFIFTYKRGEAVVEMDINSLTTFTKIKNQDFRKNKVIRTLDEIANDTLKVFEEQFIGRVNNTVDGRELFRSNRISYLSQLNGAGIIDDFVSGDVQVFAGEQKEGVYVEVLVKPTDAIEKLYMKLLVD